MLGYLLQPVYIRDDDGHNEVDHDDRAQHYDASQEQHREGLGDARGGTGGVVPQIIELKLAQDHHETEQFQCREMR